MNIVRNRKKKIILIFLCFFVIVAIISTLLVWNAQAQNRYLGNLSLSYKMTMDGQDVAQDELNYFYGMAVNSYINTSISYFGDDYSSIIKFSLEEGINSLEEQACAVTGYTDRSWAEYFLDTAAKNLMEADVLYQEAVRNQVRLDDGDREEIKKTIEDLKSYCEENDIRLEDYLRSMYGGNATLDSIQKYIEKTSLVAKYTSIKANGIEVSEQEYTDYYNENKNQIDTVTLRYFAFEKTEENKRLAARFAESVTNDEAFIKAAQEYCSEDQAEEFADREATLREEAMASTMPEYVRDWAFAEDRTPGEVAVLDGDDSIDVIMYISRNVATYRRVSARIIQVDAAENSDETSAELFEKAKARAQELLDEYEAGDQTEQRFSDMASQYSDDIKTKEKGGLNEDLTKSDVAGSVQSWCFEQEREYGDVEILPAGNGYCLMYFVAYEELDYLMTAKAMLSNEIYTNEMEGLMSSHTYSILKR